MPDVVIAGGGPVGLFLGILLLQEGVDVLVLEQRSTRSSHSRAIGIHPPALEALASASVADALTAEGVPIRAGRARSCGAEIATLSFDGVSAEYPFVLALPQCRTEEILEARLRHLKPDALLRGVKVNGVYDDGAGVRVAGAVFAQETPEPKDSLEPVQVQEPLVVHARLAVAADGARSLLRTGLGIGTRATDYPDTYLMGDFEEVPHLGAAPGGQRQAVLYLESDGIVESFPLPGTVRRWVVRTRSLTMQPSVAGLVDEIRHRTGVDLDAGTNTMLSAFSVRSRLARRMVNGKTVLIGDAAHEVSPIGGQGMNLGWLDAVELAPLITASLRGTLSGRARGEALALFDARRRRAARIASRQAHLNMMLGRPLPPGAVTARNLLVRGAFGAPAVGRTVARRFTMH